MKRRNKALTVIFSFLPGAGQMFQGFMNTGIILLSLFFGVIFLSAFFDLYIINLALPIIWCYAFFDSINKMNYDDEEFYAIKDEIPFNFKPIKKVGMPIKIAAVLLITAGVFSIWNVVYSIISDYVYSISPISAFAYSLVDTLSSFPRIVIGIIIIICGIKLIHKKKEEMKDDTDNF